MSEEQGPACDPAAPLQQRSYVHHLKEDAWGILVISKREFIANIRSFRSIIMVIILALIMVGAAMGFASLSASEEAEEDMRYQVMAMDPDGLANDLVVFLYEKGTYDPIPGRNVTLAVEDYEIPEFFGRTDERGHYVAKNLTSAYHWLIIENEEKEDGGGGGPFGSSGGSDFASTYVYVAHKNNISEGWPLLGVHAWDEDLRDVGEAGDVAVHVVDLDGIPVQGATVVVGTETNTTDAQGMTTFLKLEKGLYAVTATAGSLNGTTFVNVTREETERDPFSFALEGPDEILQLVAAIAIGLVGPIYAIVLCFDSVFRERLTGSIDYLLCRPMGRRAVLMGKFIGVLSALMVPITAVSLLGVGVVWNYAGKAPTGELVVGFVIYTVFLIAIFVLLQMIFSTLAKTTGTAILSGIGVWIFFFMLFDLILLLASYVAGLDGEAEQRFFNRASFLNPISIYSLCIAQLGEDATSIAGVPDWAPPVALIMLTFVLLLAAMEIFTRRVTE
jgi:Cu-processing system permease protein